jgi:hypothetical protein
VSDIVLAEFASEADFAAALIAVRGRGLEIVEGFTPYPVRGADEPSDPGPGRVTAAVAIAGFAVAGAFYLLEWWTATWAYPFDSGGRPPDSWPAFIMGPFEFGIFAAGLGGFVALLVQCGLPRPHDPVFELPDIERASQDRFFLALGDGPDAEAFARSLKGATVRRALL